MTKKPIITWTKIDEAPALATYSLLPIVKNYTKYADVEVETRDISLASRIIANLSDFLKPEQRMADELSYLGTMVNMPEANIIKLPNVSASIPQLKEAIKELQAKGYALPDYPEAPKTDEDQDIKAKYAKCLGSAVNPVLREGNSDRRVAPSVKANAMKNPIRLREWDSASKAHVAFMKDGDFYGNEKSVTFSHEDVLSYVLVDAQGNQSILKEGLKVKTGEVIDTTFMSVAKLRNYIKSEIAAAKSEDLLFSIHLKATMMKVSDPIIFGHFVSVFFAKVFDKHAATFAALGVNPDMGLGDLYKKIQNLPAAQREEIEQDIKNVYLENPALAMVDSDNGITNLHAGNDVIIDASMPVVIRDGGKMWNAEGKPKATKAMVPDRCYATFYQEAFEFCKVNGAFNPATMGNVSNVGLMAQKAEEYGSHDKTFKAASNGTIQLVNSKGEVLLQHEVEAGDIYRSCQTKDAAIRDWVKLAVSRARATGNPAVFWLDKNRAHDAQIILKVQNYLKEHDTQGLEILILSPIEAMQFTLPRTKAGLDTISVTGNVLRDYLTDLFPILELGTSAKMLSIVPLLNGGGLFETGAGGSAPKHVQQFLSEGHLRWDSLGEFLALTVSLEHLGLLFKNSKALLLAKTLDQAVAKHLDNGKSPSRKAGELDNRGSHFYLALYWAQALAQQTEDKQLQSIFAPVAKALQDNESKILSEIAAAEGVPTDIGGYYQPEDSLAYKAMRPSSTFNQVIDNL